jgi:hypothetical protein
MISALTTSLLTGQEERLRFSEYMSLPAHDRIKVMLDRDIVFYDERNQPMSKIDALREIREAGI